MPTNGKQFRNSVFIAYHGSQSIDGTGNQAEDIAKRLKKTFPIADAYYGPDTDERTFDIHPSKVIPDCAMFLLTVNDRCPKDEHGRLDKNTSAWLFREIRAFYELFKHGERNKKDFAVYYCGNLLRDPNDIATYVRRLLSDIDPDGELYEGNQYYIVDSIGIDEWVRKRLVNPNTSVLTDEPYCPFDLLRDKVKNIVEHTPKYMFVLQMERGMGKTTFARALERDAEFQKTARVRALYVSRDKNYASPENFLWDFSDMLRRDDNGDMRSVDIAPVDIINSDPVQSFARFVNEFKTKYYADRKLLIIIDGIDDMGAGGKLTISDFFENAEFTDGVFVMFSCRIFENADSRHNAAYGFINRFGGEKIIFDSRNYDYLNFLYNFYNDNVISKFTSRGASISVREIFNAIDPKNILSFSILMKIGKIYFDQTDAEKVDWRVLSSLESALGFFYKHMKTTLNAETFMRYKKLLVIFALSDYALTSADLKEAFGIEFSEALLKQNAYLRIFIRTHDENTPVAFGIVHDRIKQLILSDDPDFTKGLVDEIFMKADSLADSGLPLETICGEKFPVLKFFGALLSCDLIPVAEKERLAKKILALPFRQYWEKSIGIAENERLLLKSLTDYISSPDSSLAAELPDRAALAYAVYAHDCFILNFFYEAGNHFEQCKKYYDAVGVERAPYDVQRDYALMLTIYGTHLQLCRRDGESLALLKECTDLCDKLYAAHEIPLRDYVHYYVAKSNIYHSYGDLANQKKTLDKAMKIGGDEYRETDPARFAFMNTGYASYYDVKGKAKKAFKHIRIALDHYKIHFRRDPNTMFIGDMVACIGTYVVMLPQIYKDKETCLSLMRDETEFLKDAVAKTGYSNPNIDMRVHMKFADFFLKLGLKKECVAACTKLLDKINYMLAGKNRNFDTVSAFKRSTTEILRKAELLP